MVAGLLQRLGLNKYEAEAYLALLADGPLTGYELGKRSSVPLSKAYETLERLSRRGLALVQPGEPPRYLAERPERFLAQTRADHEALLAELETALAGMPAADPADEFWVLRGRPNVVTRARAAIAEAREEVLIAASSRTHELTAALEGAQARGCRVVLRPLADRAGQPGSPDLLVLQSDGQHVLAGTLTPAAHCQAVVTGNPALLAAVRGVLAPSEMTPRGIAAGTAEPDAAEVQRGLDWLAWEDRKHERLRRLAHGGRVA